MSMCCILYNYVFNCVLAINDESLVGLKCALSTNESDGWKKI